MGLTTDHLLPAAAGAAVLVAWVAVLAVGGIALTARRRRQLEGNAGHAEHRLEPHPECQELPVAAGRADQRDADR